MGWNKFIAGMDSASFLQIFRVLYGNQQIAIFIFKTRGRVFFEFVLFSYLLELVELLSPVKDILLVHTSHLFRIQ